MDLKDKKSFLLYTDYSETFKELSNEDAGILIKAIFDYVQTGEHEKLEGILKIAFIPIKQSLDRDIEKWKETRIKRSEAGRIGGINKAINQKQNLANAKKLLQSKSKLSKCKQNVANLADNVNVNVSVNDNVNVNVNDIDINNNNNINNINNNNNNNNNTIPEGKVLTAKASKHKYR